MTDRTKILEALQFQRKVSLQYRNYSVKSEDIKTLKQHYKTLQSIKKTENPEIAYVIDYLLAGMQKVIVVTTAYVGKETANKLTIRD